jgi:hypothetical protein
MRVTMAGLDRLAKTVGVQTGRVCRVIPTGGGKVFTIDGSDVSSPVLPAKELADWIRAFAAGVEFAREIAPKGVIARGGPAMG